MRFFILTIIVGVFAGCTFDVDTCLTNDDCAPGSECVLASGDLVCLFPDDYVAPDLGNDATANNSNNQTNNQNNRNNLNNLNNRNDAGTTDMNTNTGVLCDVPLVDSMCMFDNFEPNNGPLSAERLPGRGGCDDWGEDFSPSNWSIDASLCALESEDWFSFGFTRCVIRKRLIVEVTPKRDCTGNEYEIDIDGFPCSDRERVSCERMPDGGRRVVVLLNKIGDFGDDLEDVKVGIVEQVQGAEFEYHLTIQVTD